MVSDKTRNPMFNADEVNLNFAWLNHQ